MRATSGTRPTERSSTRRPRDAAGESPTAHARAGRGERATAGGGRRAPAGRLPAPEPRRLLEREKSFRQITIPLNIICDDVSILPFIIYAAQVAVDCDKEVSNLPRLKCNSHKLRVLK